MSPDHALTALLLASGGLDGAVRCYNSRIGVAQAGNELGLTAGRHTVFPRPAPRRS